jgi:MarR family transcriptional regulator for hemolysin
MLEYDFDTSVGYWVFATAHALVCSMNEELTQHGITSRQWEVLACISHEGELSQTELAERMFIEAPTLVGVLDRMERDGWIVRVTDETDRRRKLIRPTERAGEQWERMVACGLQVRARATRGLSEEQMQQVRETLKIMCVNMNAQIGPRSRKGVTVAAPTPTVAPATTSTNGVAAAAPATK